MKQPCWKRRACLVVLVCLLSTLAWADVNECMVIGERSDPALARRLFLDAMMNWRTGQSSRALQLYEEALVSDRSVLKHDDEGMARALLESYRERAAVATPSAALLCRKGFFENIIVGNLEESIRLYQQAAASAQDESVRNLARREAARLERELRFIQQWQRDFDRKMAVIRRRDLAAYQANVRRDQKAAGIEGLEEQLAQVRSRIAYLGGQADESQDTLVEELQKNARDRRRYYYANSSPDPTPDPSAAYNPPGTWPTTNEEVNTVPNIYQGEPGPDLPGNIPPQNMPGNIPPQNLGGNVTGGNLSGNIAPQNLPGNLPGTTASPRANRYLYRTYRSRRRAREAKNELDQIRAEIDGLKRRAKELEKAIKKAKEEFDKLPPVPAVPTLEDLERQRPQAPKIISR